MGLLKKDTEEDRAASRPTLCGSCGLTLAGTC
jgi:hypothetical protein